MMTKALPGRSYAATQSVMRGRFTSLLVFLGLFVSIVVAPAIAHASDHVSIHAGELVDVHEIDLADHEDQTGSDKEQPCHAISHHHCGVALSFDVPRVGMNTITKAATVPPASTTPLLSRTQAPPLDPPNA
jgi:hypothetical protein